MENKIKNIQIIGRRWFDKANGNTYFSAVGIVDGVEEVRIPFEYGYEEHYLDRTFQELTKKFNFPIEKYENGNQEMAWQYCQRTGIKLLKSVADVKTKKELMKL